MSPAFADAARRGAPWIGLLALIALAAAGDPMRRQLLPLWAAAALAYGFLVWLLLPRFAPLEPSIESAPGPAAGWPRPVPLALVLPLAAGAWVRTAGNEFRPGAVPLWLAAVGMWVVAWAPGKKAAARGSGAESAGRARPSARVLLALAVIVAAAALVYFHALERTPANPTSDHAETLLDVQDLLAGKRPIFFIRNTGREPWKFYWLLGLVELFGLPPDFFTTKVGTVTTALLAIPAMFLLGRELGGDRMGLFAAALLAWSKWPLAMARLGIRVSYVVLPTAMVLWAVLRYLRKGDRASALWCGLWIGIGLYGYIPFRIVPLFVPVFFALAAFDRRWRGSRGRLLPDVLLVAATAALVFLPLLHYAVEQPDHFFGRMAERSGDLESASAAERLAVFTSNLRNMALAYHWYGDGGWVNFVMRDPFLDPVAGALFLAGLALSLSRTADGSLRWLVPVAGLFLLTLPSTLIFQFVHENPSVNRSAAAIPAVFLLCAAPLSYLALGFARVRRPIARAAGWGALAALLALSIAETARRYFVDYHRQYDLLVEHSTEAARAIAAHRASGVAPENAYLLTLPHWIDPRNVAFELGRPGWSDTNAIAPDQPPPRLARRPLLFVFRPDDAARREALRRTYPAGRERLVPQSFPDRNFSVYLVR